MKDETDITDTLLAKSLQMNAEDLISGPVVVRITGVKRNADDKQPIAVEVEGRQPFIPCKTMRRLLCQAWGTNAKLWIGRLLKLYRDPTVVYAGQEVGGIRIAAMSHIDKEFDIKLCERRGYKKKFVVGKLETNAAASAPQTPAPDVKGMVAAWKAKNPGSTQDDLREFVETATDGEISKADALNPSKWTQHLLAVCMSMIAEPQPVELPSESPSDDISFGEVSCEATPQPDHDPEDHPQPSDSAKKAAPAKARK